MLKIFVRVQTFRRVPPVLPRNFCHPGAWYVLISTFTDFYSFLGVCRRLLETYHGYSFLIALRCRRWRTAKDTSKSLNLWSQSEKSIFTSSALHSCNFQQYFSFCSLLNQSFFVTSPNLFCCLLYSHWLNVVMNDFYGKRFFLDNNRCYDAPRQANFTDWVKNRKMQKYKIYL